MMTPSTSIEAVAAHLADERKHWNEAGQPDNHVWKHFECVWQHVAKTCGRDYPGSERLREIDAAHQSGPNGAADLPDLDADECRGSGTAVQMRSVRRIAEAIESAGVPDALRVFCVAALKSEEPDVLHLAADAARRWREIEAANVPF